MKRITAIGILGLVVTLAACSSSRMVQVPPRVDLGGLGTVGLIEISSAKPGDDLGRKINRQFLTAIQAAQPGVPVLELGDEARVLRDARSGNLDPETMRAIGEEKRVDVILYGVLETQEVRPKVSLGTGLESLSAKAEIEATLITKLYDTRTGATLWTGSASDRRTLAALTISGSGVSGAGASDPDAARTELANSLVARATSDFRPTWMRVRE